MKSIKVIAAMLLMVGTQAIASQDLAKANNCLACHAVDKKLVGPAFKDIAAKYKPADQAKIAVKIRKGGSGVWGPIPMPAQPHISEADANKLAAWVLSR